MAWWRRSARITAGGEQLNETARGIPSLSCLWPAVKLGLLTLKEILWVIGFIVSAVSGVTSLLSLFFRASHQAGASQINS